MSCIYLQLDGDRFRCREMSMKRHNDMRCSGSRRRSLEVRDWRSIKSTDHIRLTFMIFRYVFLEDSSDY